MPLQSTIYDIHVSLVKNGWREELIRKARGTTNSLCIFDFHLAPLSVGKCLNRKNVTSFYLFFELPPWPLYLCFDLLRYWRDQMEIGDLVMLDYIMCTQVPCLTWVIGVYICITSLYRHLMYNIMCDSIHNLILNMVYKHRF